MAQKSHDYYYVEPGIVENDPFICLEIGETTAQENKTKILGSLLKPADEYLNSFGITTNEAFRKCYKNNEGERKINFLRCAVPLHVQRLQEKKNIESLSALLDINDTTFIICVLRAIQTLLLELSLNDTPVVFIDKCLNGVLQCLKNSESDDMLRIHVNTINTVLRCRATAVIFYCEYKESKKELFTSIKKTCSSIAKIWGGLKSGNTQAHQNLKSAISLLKTMEKFKLEAPLKELFGRSADSFALSKHDTFLAEIARRGSIAEQFVVTVGILRKLQQNPKNMCEKFTCFLLSIFNQKAGQRFLMGKDTEIQQLEYLAISGIVYIYKKFSQITWTDLSGLIDACVTQIRNRQLEVPEEMTDLIFHLKKEYVQNLIESLGVSEDVPRLAEVYIEKLFPDLKIYDDHQHLPKLSDDFHWMLSSGRFFSNSVRVAILVPEISDTQTGNMTVSDKNKRIENEFEILVKLQDGKTHSNILKMFAFNPLRSPLHVHVIENFQIFLMDKVFQARRKQEFLHEKWIVNRLLEIISAVIYLHENNIIHRDLTLNAFAIKTLFNVPAEYEPVVLCNLQMANMCLSDTEASAMPGQVADVHGKNIATRWSAPESLWEGKFDFCTDTWMVGHLIHALFTHGCEPYTELYSETTDEIMAKVVSCGLKPYKWPCIPLSYHQLAASCLNFDRQKRPSLQYIQTKLQDLRVEINHNEMGQRKRCYTSTMPRISTSQLERAHQPERGIPDVVNKMKEYRGSKRDSYFRMREKIPQSPDPNYVPLTLVFTKQDLRSPNDPAVRKKRFEEEVEEKVTVNFYDSYLPNMKKDFAKKMGIKDWPPEMEVKQDKITEIKLIYRFPKARNIMDLALDWCENQNHDKDLEVIYQVSSLVQQMHEKHWILVDIVGKNIYVQEENDFKACQFRIGRMVRLAPNEDSIIMDRKMDELDDIVNWLPREVIGNGEFSEGSDVYTMAMLFYEFYMALSGTDRLQCVPFRTTHRTRILSHLLNGHVPECPLRCPEWLYKEVMIPCWDQDRTYRPSARDVFALIAGKRDQTRKPLPRNLLLEDDSYIDVIKVSDDEESNPKRISEMQYDRYDSPKVDAINDWEHLSEDKTSRSAFSKDHSYANSSDIYSSGDDKCTLQKDDLFAQVKTSLITESHLKYRPSHGELIDVPNYDLFSQEDSYVEPDDVSISDPPSYENETVLVSMKKTRKVQSKRTALVDTCPPTSHSVYKENPIFQSDASSPGIGRRDSERTKIPSSDIKTQVKSFTNRNAKI